MITGKNGAKTPSLLVHLVTILMDVQGRVTAETACLAVRIRMEPQGRWSDTKVRTWW